MSVRAMHWVWTQSRSGPTERLVLLAIADCANDQGQAWPSMAALVEKTRLGERTVQRAVATLVDLGELAAVIGGGRGRTTKYRLLLPESESETPSEKPRQSDARQRNPVSQSKKPRQPRQETPSETTVNPATAAPGTVKNHQGTTKEPSVPAVPAATLSITQRSKRITDAYAEVEPMCRWPAVNGVVMKAIKAERWVDDEIRAAVLRLAAEGRSVTVETLRIELEGLPPRRPAAPRGYVEHNGHHLKVETAANLELIERIAQREQQQPPQQPSGPAIERGRR